MALPLFFIPDSSNSLRKTQNLFSLPIYSFFITLKSALGNGVSVP